MNRSHAKIFYVLFSLSKSTYLIIVPAFLLFSCGKNEKRSNSLIKNVKIEIPYIWKDYYCLIPGFSSSLYCDHEYKEKYQIELTTESYQASVFILLELDSSKITMKHTKITYSDSNNFKSKANIVKIPIQPDRNINLYCQYSDFKEIALEKCCFEIFDFFHNQIWNIPCELANEDTQFDPEVWRVIGRKNGLEKKWTRMTFTDSVFYSNIQKVLDYAKIKEYKYKKTIYNIIPCK